MLDPYKMVFVNGVLSLLVITFIVFYKYVYPKKNIPYFLVLILFSIIACVSIFRTGVYESGDFTIHTYRAIEFYRSLSEGIAMPSWAAGLNADYGYALFIFNYTLPYYVISFFHFLGFSFITSMKLFLACNFILSGIFMYLFARQLLKNNTAAFITAIFYQFAPYHLIDLHFKIVIGEITIFTLLPISFYCLLRLWNSRNSIWLWIASFVISLLIMSHVVLALFGILLFMSFAVYKWIQTRKKYYIFSTFFVLLFSTASTIFIWLTPFIMSKYTILIKDIGFVYFPQLWELLYAPWRGGFLFQGPKGELSYLLGYAHIFVFLLILVLLLSKKIRNKIRADLLFWVLVFVFVIFLIIPYSKFIWGIIPLMKVTGSHRLLILAAFASSILAGYLALQLSKKKLFLIILVAATIFSTMLNWGHRRVIPEIKEQDVINNVWLSTSQVEGHLYANSRWRNSQDPWFSKRATNPLDVLQGKATFKKLERTSIKHTYVVSADTNVQMRENTLYFPGWKLYVNNKESNINPDKDGLISLKLNKGLYYLNFVYEDIPIYKLLKVVSVTSIAITISAIFILGLRTLMKQKKRLFSRFSRNN